MKRPPDQPTVGLVNDRELGSEETSDSQKTQLFSNDYETALPKHYRLIEMLGRGGMAEVFLAEDKRLHRRVAIKFLNSEFRKDPERMRRFNQEARAASALNHPNILTIHDIGENQGVQFIVSEFIEGETLSSQIRRGKIPLGEAVDIAMQIASALAVSHKVGIVHRDLKPDNIMIRHDGSVKILDFGLAKETGGMSSKSALDATTLDGIPTSPGLILGTPQYMSPEQARGKPLDARTDIFSLGIIIFEMVAGRPPFAGESMADIIAAIIGKEPHRLEEYLDEPPLTLIHIVEKSLRKDRVERYGSMEHLLSDLKDLRLELVDEPPRVHQTDGAETRTTAHNPIRTTIRTMFTESLIPWRGAIFLAVALVAVLAFSAWWFLGGGKQDQTVVQGSMRTVPITNWSSGARELVTAASFSPDARMVAFAATKTGATEIWVKPTAGGDEIQVTKNGSYNQYPIWSPNNHDIAFFSSRGNKYGIWRAAFTGGEQVQIASGVGATARPLLWTKEGKIYFQEGSELYTIDEKTAERTRLTDFESKGPKPRVIEVSSDGMTIAYSVKEDDGWKLRTKRLDGEASEVIAVSKEQIDDFSWHPNGESVIYSSSVDGAYQIFEAGPGRGPVQISNGNDGFLIQDVSADGLKVLYGSVNEASDLWAVDTQDRRESVVANDVAAEYWTDVSPDGKGITFQSVTQTERPFSGSIKLKSSMGAPTQVTPLGFSPVWSKDGRWIAFFKRTETGIELWRVGPNGYGAVKLADGNVSAPGYTETPYLKIGTNHISWSPDSSYVAYSAPADGVSNIWIANADDRQNTPLTNNKDVSETYCCAVWTPDGKSLVFTSEVKGSNAGPPLSRLWLYQVENREQRMVFESTERFRFLGLANGGKDAIISQKDDPADLTATPKSTNVYSLSLQTGAKSKVNSLENAYFHNVHLSRDGGSIAFVSRRDDVTTLWTVPVNGGTPKQLLIENDPKLLISSLTWSPDGRSIVFGKQTRTNLLSMLTK